MKIDRAVYVVAGYNTISMGSGRPEFKPGKPMPKLLDYIREAGQAVLRECPDPRVIDEGIISNFMAARFNHQGHLAAFLPAIDPALLHKPATRVEAACASGGVALYTGVKSILSGLSDVVLCLGVEVQNSVKALYGADYLAGAAYFDGERKAGHAFFFPELFSRRAGAYAERYGRESARRGMGAWYKNAIENARLEPKAQEHHNTASDLLALGQQEPDGSFLPHLNVTDCSKVSDGASALILASAEGLAKLGMRRDAVVQIVALGQTEGDLTQAPADLCVMDNSARSVRMAFQGTNLSMADMGMLEVHDCFGISGILALEACGLATTGQGWKCVADGMTARSGACPVNLSGGLMGFGHYTGGTGLRQAVDIFQQCTNRAGTAQIALQKGYAMMMNMGGNDKTASTVIFRKP